MPNIWTHLIFGQELLAEANLDDWIRTEEQQHVFNMGCQGPDFLFYHNFLPWEKGKTMNELGSAMHNEQCGPVLLNLLSHVRSNDRATALYTLGFLLHHILDRHMHPYVFSRSGSRKWDHQRFEVLMDTHVVREKLQLETWNTPVWKIIDIGGTLPDGVLAGFNRVVHAYYPAFKTHIPEGAWNKAIQDMIKVQKLCFDPYGWKRALTFYQAEALVYKRNPPRYDVLNTKHRPWLDPTGTGETYSTSVWDMWETARADGLQAIHAVIELWDIIWHPHFQSHQASRNHAYANLERIIGNRSYETGLDLSSNRPITVEDPIWSEAK
ncbi:zinc dependent phospholipase C family protein [Paenibacillus sp. 1001270B_150601_E10]|uniref:zinc dependent phospholipase C family protein n=1 Tax=Paenibacillus sp. 1001270B_150601_E10 TaxID=2787079 RepID=UPI00189D36A9|nr:zinc dependent phospholipase C family protein [Paenibacillus sp. 1001270B_150601_E10]